METRRKTWRKSSYSGSNGGDCIECAPIGTVTWRKSSFSGSNGGECVEVATAATPCIAIRDSKNPGGAVLTVSRRRFEDFVNSLSM